METNDLLRKAARESGDEYLRTEREIRSQGAAGAAALLRPHLNDPDPFVSFTARTLMGWYGPQAPEYQAALDYLDSLPKRIARTPVPTPSPTGAAAYLEQHFGNRVADLLSLRLAKASNWPYWKIMAVLFYLRNQGAQSATPGLVRFAAETSTDEYLNTAIEAIRRSGHVGVGREVAAEQKRAKDLNKSLPPALAAMAQND